MPFSILSASHCRLVSVYATSVVGCMNYAYFISIILLADVKIEIDISLCIPAYTIYSLLVKGQPSLRFYIVGL